MEITLDIKKLLKRMFYGESDIDIELIANMMDSELVLKVVNELPTLERIVIKMRYDLLNPYGTDEIVHALNSCYGCEHGRYIRRYFDSAIHNLKHPKNYARMFPENVVSAIEEMIKITS